MLRTALMLNVCGVLMARKKVIKKSEEMKAHQAEVDKIKLETGAGKELALREASGGSISGRALAVKDKKSFNKWLVEIQDRNPFIGKDYMVRAEEYETDDKQLENEELEADENTVSSLIDGNIDLDDIESIDLDDLNLEELEAVEEALRQAEVENKFIDHCIVTNATKHLLGKGREEIQKVVESEMKTYHRKDDYVTKIDIDESIDRAETKLLLAQEEKVKKVEQIAS
jgi:hypothetical protein